MLFWSSSTVTEPFPSFISRDSSAAALRGVSGAGVITAGGVFSDDMIDAYMELKQEEIERLNMTTHPVEFDLYYSV